MCRQDLHPRQTVVYNVWFERSMIETQTITYAASKYVLGSTMPQIPLDLLSVAVFAFLVPSLLSVAADPWWHCYTN